WTAEAARLRRHLIDDVAFHGWPKEWVDSAPRFEEIGVIETGGGYRIRKLRYEIVPGFYSTALLYEPQHPSGKMPAILHVHGHVGAVGKAIEFKQKRCINYAKHGVVALSLDWFLHGELNEKGNDHWLGAQLDLAGANVLGIFYLEMRRGLDYLYNDPNVDRTRIGVTGLSGGGWQDERVKAANPVAGFSSLRSKIEANGDRTIGIEAAQLIGVARWAEKCSGAAKVRLETGGIRTQAIGLVAAALEPGLFSEISVRNGMHSLSYVFNLPVEFEQAPELFCLDLYKEFDIDSLEALAGPATVRVAHYRELP
ncbi:MAG TPA: acetylxylan esterase, partial [Acidobacteriaceae bacterium]|nr:acetylxylan esterase [Acidobacteriaceae bacterium]